MKRFLCLLCVLLLVPAVVFSDEYLPINDFEKNFVGGWVMYASRPDGTIYHYTLTFTEDRAVYFRSLVVTDGKPQYNEIATGQFTEFLSNTILLSLSDKTFVSTITEDDILKLIDYKTMKGNGFFTRCPDMGYTFGD